MKILTKIFRSKFDEFSDNPDIRYSFISIIVVILIATFLLSFKIVGKTYEYNIGDIAREEIRVPREINYVNEDETAIKKKRAAESVPAVFDKNPAILLEKLKHTGILMTAVKTTLQENPPFGTDDLTFQLMSLKTRLPKYINYDDAVLTELLRYNDSSEIKRILFRILIYLYDDNDLGLLEKPYENSLKLSSHNIAIRKISVSEKSSEVIRNVKDLRTIDEVKNRLYGICYSLAPNLPRRTLRTVTRIIRSNLRPNLRFNYEETKRRIDETVKKTKPVMGILKNGQIIAREGDTITIDMMNKISILNKNTGSFDLSYIAGIFLIQLIFMLILGFFIIEYSQFLVPDRKSILIIFTLMILFMIYTFFISGSEVVSNSNLVFALLLPIPFMTMIISILYNVYLSMIVGLFVVFFSSMIAGADLALIVLSFSSALVGVFINVNVEKRTDFIRGGFILGFINAVVLLSIALMEEMQAGDMIRNTQLAFANGLINSFLALGILPIYENVFGITTKFRLLELSDLNADLFKKMLVNAPGTYNHSLVVSTMAESACKDINANYLLARVGAYYHDIGKIEDSGMYIENRITDPRAKILDPAEYSKLIISHVEKGVKLAMKNDIPDSVINFIREHHGKTTMTYFYHKALEEANRSNSGDSFEKSDFQYPGPKPATKETAIVMLADAVEAASRSLQEPTREKLEGLVRKIIYNKLNERELEKSDLSMTDLDKIEEAFLSILNGIFHSRIEYPDSEELKNLENEVMKKNGNH